MAKPGTVLALDQGTTSSRAIVFGPDLAIRGLAQREFAQHYPASGWVEHDPEDIWRTTVETARQALAGARLAAAILPRIGITNQRETCVLWDRRTGQPIHRAIVWQDRRTADACRKLKEAGNERGRHRQDRPAARSLFLGDQDRLAARQRGGRACVGQGRPSRLRHHRHVPAVAPDRRASVHATDATNASRTLLYDIAKGAFDDELLAPLQCSARDPARGARLQCGVRYHRALDPRRRAADPGRGGRSAGGHHRPGLLHARHGQGDLRHRLLCAAQHRRQARRLAATGC